MKKLPSNAGFFERLIFRINHPDGIFYDEEIMTDVPFVESVVPENPRWMNQPSPNASLPWHLRPIKFNPK